MFTVTTKFEGELLTTDTFATLGEARDYASMAWEDAAVDPDGVVDPEDETPDEDPDFLTMARMFATGPVLSGTLDGFEVTIVGPDA